jgi:hypothetical protein
MSCVSLALVLCSRIVMTPPVTPPGGNWNDHVPLAPVAVTSTTGGVTFAERAACDPELDFAFVLLLPQAASATSASAEMQTTRYCR